MSVLSILPNFLEGLKITLSIWVITFVVSFVLAIVLINARLSKNKFISNILNVYIYTIRGTPLLLQLMLIYFGLPYIGIVFDRMTASYIAFIINYTAYFIEILRGGLKSIDVGQSEAAFVLGYSKRYTFLNILLPQAIKNCIPSFINECLTLLKDTCLVSVVGIDELLRAAKIASSTYATSSPFIYVGIVYLLLNIPITKFLNAIERKMSYY